jgi:outer membrane protein OmpA-like peptidoglycan-associated protein
MGHFAALSNTTYSLSATVVGYLPMEPRSIVTKVMKAGNVMKITLMLSSIADGGTFKVKNVNYDFGKAVLKKAAFKELDKVVKFMKDNPNVKIELGSHSDSRGSLKSNMDLSQKRAQSCVTYLTKKGISKDRIVAKGYGPTKPLVKNAKTEKQHAKNRRTEVKVLTNKK